MLRMHCQSLSHAHNPCHIASMNVTGALYSCKADASEVLAAKLPLAVLAQTICVHGDNWQHMPWRCCMLVMTCALQVHP